ncbi:MAG: glycosyltransferase family 2 protein [Bacteroidaceae bacterium]|nr:glycosyltransferase family 2 protein [Bacteroidaceae bacterium]
MDIDLSIIIISYNTRDITRQCLNSIRSSTFTSKIEIILVDNNSQDGSVSMVKKEFPEVKIIENVENKYFAIANNQGFSISSGRWVLLLNSDTLLKDDNVQKMLDFADSMPANVGCLGPIIKNIDGTIQSYGFSGLSHYDMFVKHFKLDKIVPQFLAKYVLPIGTYAYNKNIPHRVYWVSGAAMMLRSSMYRKLGGLNESLEFYGEEPELGFRMEKNGYQTIVYPFSEITHLGGQSTTQKCDMRISLRRYDLIVTQTVGRRYAIGTSFITLLAYFGKYVLKRESNIKNLIYYEWSVIKYMMNHI